MVQETTWTVVSGENEINKAMQCLQLNAIPGFCKQKPTNAGNADNDNMIEK